MDSTRIFRTIFTGLFLLLTQVTAQTIDLEKAKAYFKEAEELSIRDGGKLWGMTLMGPMVFVDRMSGEGVANGPVPVEGWKEEKGVFWGTMPEDIGFANTAFKWEGRYWTMVIFSASKSTNKLCLLKIIYCINKIVV